METFTTNISIGLAEKVNASTIAETAVEMVINALRSNINPIHPTAELSSSLYVDRETNVVAVAQELLSDILAQRLAALKKQHNNMLSIHKLPVEILAHIISISIHSQPWSISTLSGLASVCSRWWRIIISTPSLWATASLGEKPELAVKMSKDLPLRIYVRDEHRFKGLQGFIDITCPHAHRWQSVFIHSKLIACALPCFAIPFPRLEKLSLGCPGLPGGPGTTMTLGAMPRLRHLSLYRIIVDWEALPHLSLETLSLSSLQHLGPSMRQLYKILASSPHLTSLILNDLSDPIDAEEFQAEVLSLDHLNEVDIGFLGLQTLTGIAKILQTRSLSYLSIQAVIPPDTQTSHLQNLLRPSSKDGLLPSVIRNQALNRVYVKALASELQLTDQKFPTAESESCLNIDIYGMDTAPLSFLGGPDRGYDVGLDVTEYELRDEALHHALSLADPSVLRVGDDIIPSIMEELSRVPMPSERWFCPRLSDLQLVSDTFDRERAKRMLQVRNGPEKTGALTGRSKLSVYDPHGLLC